MSLPFSRSSRSLQADSPKNSLYMALMAIFLLLLWMGWFCFGSLTLFEVSHQARLEVEAAPHPVAAPVAGKILSVSMMLAREVKAGDVLVELDVSTEKLRLLEEETRLAALPPQIDALKAEIAAAEAGAERDHRAALNAVSAARSRFRESTAAANFASDYAKRLVELRKSGRISEIDALRMGAESQKSQAAADAIGEEIHRLEMDAQARAHQQAGQLQELHRRLADLQGQAVTVRATVARLQAEIDKHIIRSPVDGRIGDTVPLHPGSFVGEGEKLGTVVPSGRLRIVADFAPAAVLGRIKPNQTAWMRLAGFPWAQYGAIPARVTRVASEIRDNLVRVELTPDSSPPSEMLMQHGLPGAVEVALEQVSPAILVLRSLGQALVAPAERAETSRAGP